MRRTTALASITTVIVLCGLLAGPAQAQGGARWTDSDLTRVQNTIRLIKDVVKLLKIRAAGKQVTLDDAWTFLKNRLAEGGVKNVVILNGRKLPFGVTLPEISVFKTLENYIAPVIQQ